MSDETQNRPVSVSSVLNQRPTALSYTVSEMVAYISKEAIPVGATLPSFQDLGRRFGVGAATVQRAVARLVEIGLLRSEPRRGTFLAASVDQIVFTAGSPTLVPEPTRSTRLSRGESVETLTIGLVADLPPASESFPWSEALWPYLMVSAVERALADESQVALQFDNRIGPSGGPCPIRESVERLTAKGVDGIIVYAALHAHGNDEPIAVYKARQVPIVIASDHAFLPPIPVVYFDVRQTGYIAAQHVIEQGYRRLIYTAPFAADWVMDRLDGIKRAIADSSAPVELRIFIDESASPEYMVQGQAARSYAAQWMGEIEPGVAIIGANDNVAHGILETFDKMGLTPGVDFGLIGFDDLSESRERGITSVRPPIERIGSHCVHMILDILRTGSSAASQVRMPPYLIPRASTRPIGQR